MIRNVGLGLLLVVFPTSLTEALGMPAAPSFYHNILGGVLIGIGITLFLEKRSRLGSKVGLIGAIAINLSGGFVLAGRLLLGDLGLPLHGFILLRIPVIVL